MDSDSASPFCRPGKNLEYQVGAEAGPRHGLSRGVPREVARKLGSAARDQVMVQWNFTRDLDGMRTTLESVNALLRDAAQRSAREDVRVYGS
uniref:Disease resistance N-terminal domain-containing protein n=1 Tax=Oryza meridionalis TaxID=40149 RepID=A0A0E0DPD6_9ORYZ